MNLLANNSLTSGNGNEVNVDKSISKIIFLAILGGIFLAIFGYFLKLVFLRGEFNFFLLMILSATVFLIIFLLQSVFIKSLRRINLIIFLECLALFGSFYDKFLTPAISYGAIAVFLILIWANRNGVREMENMLKINFWRVSKIVLPKSIMGLAIFSSFVFVGLNKGEFFISSANFEKLILPAAPIIEPFFPDFDFSLSLDQLIANLVNQEISAMPQAQDLPKSAKNQLINQSSKEMKNKILNLLGVPVDTKMKITDAAYEAIKKRFSDLPENFKGFILIGAAFFLFLTIESFAWPIRLIISAIAFIIYEILLALGFASIILEGRSREIILLK